MTQKKKVSKKKPPTKLHELPEWYQQKLKKERFAKKMRFAPTPAEAKLHNAMIEVMKDTLTEVSIQHIIGPYIGDMKIKNLIVEIDGSTHAGREEYDERRTSYIKNHGYQVIRFKNCEIYENAEECAQHIRTLTEPHQAKTDIVKITYCPPSKSFPSKFKKRKSPYIIGWRS